MPKEEISSISFLAFIGEREERTAKKTYPYPTIKPTGISIENKAKLKELKGELVKIEVTPLPFSSSLRLNLPVTIPQKTERKHRHR